MDISKMTDQGWIAILTRYRKALRPAIYTSRFFIQQPPKKGNGSRGLFKFLR